MSVNHSFISSLISLALSISLLFGAAAARGDEHTAETRPSAHEHADHQQVEQRLGELERQLEQLRGELARARRQQPSEDTGRLDELERRIEVLAEEIERLQLGEAAATADRGEFGLGPAASKVYRSSGGVSIGGYGELLYQNFSSERDDGSDSGARDQFDFLRAVLYFGYKFNDRWLLNTEIEYEHSSTGAEGEVALEFAYIDYLWKPELGVRAGLLLVPMGLINELHEPTVFRGSLRPDSERSILPSTWRENGVGVFGESGMFSYRSYLVNGFDASGFSASGLRGGRQKGSKALAEDFAWVGRVDLTPMPGLLAGGSLYLGNSGQGIEGPDGESLGVFTRIVEGHVDYHWQGLELRGLLTSAWLDDVAELNQALGLEGAAGIGERMWGGYFQLGYDLLAREGGQRSLTPFFRFEKLNTHDRVPEGFESDPRRDQRILTFGVDFKPIDQIVIKADYQDRHDQADSAVDQFNVLLGYIF